MNDSDYLKNYTEYSDNPAHNQVVDYMHQGSPTTAPTGEEALKIALEYTIDSCWDCNLTLDHAIEHLQPLPLHPTELSEIIEALKEAKARAEYARELIERITSNYS